MASGAGLEARPDPEGGYATAAPDGPAGQLVARLLAAQSPERPTLERAPGGLLMVDANLAITDANAPMLEIVGVSRRDLVGSPLSAYFQVPENAAEAIHQAFAHGGAAMFELALRSSRATPPAELPAPEPEVRTPMRCIFGATLR